MTAHYFPGTARAVLDKNTQRFSQVGSVITPNVVVLHSTEGWDWPSYSSGAVAPNMTIKPDFSNKRVLVRQHFAANRSSRALENRAGGVQTNTLNAFQIEMVGTCDPNTHKHGPANHVYMPDPPQWFIEGVADVIKWLHDTYGLKIQDAAPRGWVGPEKSPARLNAPQRMTFAEWNNGYGIVGHQHVPENGHWDPGAFPIAKLVDAAKGKTTPTPPKPVPPTDPPVVVPPVATGPLVETISANLAGYDTVGNGAKTRVARAKTTIPNYFNTKKPTWFHFQECAIDMVPELDKRLKGYTRVEAGGKGRESYYRNDAGIKIVAADLKNVTHMLAKDTKEFLVIVYELDGKRAVEVNFHNENQGSTFQPLQLVDVLRTAKDVTARHGAKMANTLATGDSNLKTAATLVRLYAGWSEVSTRAKKKIDLQWKSTNGWVMNLAKGARIDVDITGSGADVLEAEQLYGALTGDHWPHRVLRRLV